MKEKMKSSLLVTVGYLLSPLSWWNDPFVNLPIAYLFGLLCGLFSPRAFTPGMIVGYWASNVAGLVLLHKGASGLLERDEKSARRELVMNLVVSAAYTGIILLLIHAGIVRLPWKGTGP